jgi:arsenate reductase (thioredoxin)
MAEGFARRYGSDVMEVASAGLFPAAIIQPLTYKVMEEKNISLEGQSPKSLDEIDVTAFDIIINMSGRKLPGETTIDIRDWRVEDPIGQEEGVYLTVRDKLEMAVMSLILELRRAANPNSQPASRPARWVSR